MKKRILLVLPLLSSFLFPSCGNSQGEQEFKSVYFDSINVTYDGEEHILSEVRGAPEGTEIVYSGRESFIDAGTYKATATLSKENYKTKTLEATLSILPAAFSDVSYDSVTVTFNEQDHYDDIQVVGELPAGTTVTQVVTDDEEKIVKKGEVTYPGVYHYLATLTNRNYRTVYLSALLTIKSAQFTDVTFESMTVSYDGNEHILGEVIGAPEGTEIVYGARESHTDVGSYPAIATLSKPGYIEKALQATLTITPVDFPTDDINYRPKSVAYDGVNHINDVQITGLPEIATLSQTVKNEKGDVVTEAIDIGIYTYTAEITFKNYNPLIFTSSLTIRNYMPIYVYGDNTIYFSNWKDNRSLYSLDSAGTFTRIDSSPVKNFKSATGSTLLFNANTGLMNSIKQVDMSNHSVDFICTDGEITDLVKKDDNTYYYSKKSTDPNGNGIYKVDLTKTGEDEIVSRVYKSEADNLYLHNDDLYFINSENSSIRKFDVTKEAAVVVDVVKDAKVNEFIISGNALYCSVNESTNHYIGYINLNSTSVITKIAEDKAGEFLRLNDNKIYFNYSPAYGATDPSEYGIWSVEIIDTQHTQTHVLTNGGIDGFGIDPSRNIVYADRNNPNSLYRYNPTTSTKTDLLANFTKPGTIPTKEKGKSIFHSGKLYYLNMHANRSLWSYDENSKKNTQLSTGSVTDFAISGGSIFINQPTTTDNNDIYCASINGTSKSKVINKNDLREMTLDAGYIYGTSYESNNPTGIARMKTDGTLFNKFSNVTTATDYVIRPSQEYLEGQFMFINRYSGKDVGDIVTIGLNDITDTSTGLTGEKLHPSAINNVKQFFVSGNDIHFLYDGDDGNYIKLAFFSSGEAYIKMGGEVPIRAYEFSIVGDYYYFYSHSDNDAGFYRIGRHVESESSYEKLLDYGSKYYGSCFAWSGSRLYFLNYRPEFGTGLGNAHTYCLDIDQKTIEQIDN